jgi:hypothetical protein
MRKDTAIVMSCHEYEVPGTWRINLKWQRNHEISDFDRDRLGSVQRAEAESEQTGYVIVKTNNNPNIGDKIPAR